MKDYASGRQFILSRVTIGDGCWEWQRAKTCGYGAFTAKRKQFYAHRKSFEFFNERSITQGMQINHKCHNRACCRPSHLYEGSFDDNMRDMVEAGRSTKGMKNVHAILTDDDVRQIYKLRRAGVTLQAIADRFGVALTTIWHVVNGKTWTHVQKTDLKDAA